MTRICCPEDIYPKPLLAVVGYGLPGASRQLPDKPLDGKTWSSMLETAKAHRVIGELSALVSAGTFPATASQKRQVLADHVAATFWVLTLERELISLIKLLTSASVPTRLLKGAAVAYLDYPDPSLRSFIDLDVLVRAEDFDRAVQVLVDAGFVRRLEQPRPGFDRRFDKGTTLVAPAGYELDLHRTFVLGPWGLRVDLDDLWDRGQQVVVAGYALQALSPVNRFMHACYHAALGDWPLRLASLRDVAQILLGRQCDERAIREQAHKWRAEAVVAASVADTWRLLGLRATTGLPAWAERHVPSRADELKLALHTHPNKTFAAQALSTLRALPRLRDKVAYARALALPDSKYVAGRHHSSLTRFRYGISEAIKGRPKPTKASK